MRHHAERTRALAHTLVRHIVRVTAVAALSASSAAAAAEELRPVEEDDDLEALDGALRRATEHVLASPPEPHDRALLILFAAREAVAYASVPDPQPRHTAALLENAGIVEHLATEVDGYWFVEDDPPPRRR